jgi:hypothetical protein
VADPEANGSSARRDDQSEPVEREPAIADIRAKEGVVLERRIATARTKDGKTKEPLEETRSEGSVSLAFTPGKLAELKILRPPASVCLLFAVPAGFKTGQITGLGPKALVLPPLTTP